MQDAQAKMWQLIQQQLTNFYAVAAEHRPVAAELGLNVLFTAAGIDWNESVGDTRDKLNTVLTRVYGATLSNYSTTGQASMKSALEKMEPGEEAKVLTALIQAGSTGSHEPRDSRSATKRKFWRRSIFSSSGSHKYGGLKEGTGLLPADRELRSAKKKAPIFQYGGWERPLLGEPVVTSSGEFL